MRLKTFNAPSMPEALKMVRAALGDDAIIVTSKEGKNGHTRITAAVENLPEPAFEPVASLHQDLNNDKKATKNIKKNVDDNDEFDEDALLRFFQEHEDLRDDDFPASQKPTKKTKKPDAWQPPKLQSSEREIEDYVTDTLLRHRTPAAVSEKIISAAISAGAETPDMALRYAIRACFQFAPLPLIPHKKPLVLVGPPGAGKTLSTAKMAARAKFNNLNVAVISTDTLRAGGIEQLESFLNILDVPLYTAHNAASLKKTLTNIRKSSDQIIIDTGGINPFSPKELKDLAKLLNVCAMDPILVLAAGGDAEECAEIAMTFNILGITKILPTRLDFSRRLGGILSAADRVNLSFADASHTHSIADGLVQLDFENLSHILTSGSLIPS